MEVTAVKQGEECYGVVNIHAACIHNFHPGWASTGRFCIARDTIAYSNVSWSGQYCMADTSMHLIPAYKPLSWCGHLDFTPIQLK